MLNDGVPIHVVQRYLGHASPEMTLRYAATLAATAEAEFLKHKKIGAHGVEIAISPADILDMTQLSQRTDRVLPNGVCLLPPLKSCDKGNACLSCGHFATDATHTGELRDQHTKTTALIELRRDQYRQRTGRELTDDNVWIRERLRELCCHRVLLVGLSASRIPHTVTESPLKMAATAAPQFTKDKGGLGIRSSKRVLEIGLTQRGDAIPRFLIYTRYFSLPEGHRYHDRASTDR